MSSKTKAPINQPIGEHSYGDGLSLVVASENSRRWMSYVYIAVPAPAKPQRIKYWIGSVAEIEMSVALGEVKWARAHGAAGRDPRIEYQKKLAAELLIRNRANGPTFIVFARECWERWKSEWKTERQVNAWINSLVNHAGPIHNMQLSAITSQDIIACLEPIWKKSPIIAQDVLSRIRRVLGAAAGRYRDETVTNPAVLTQAMLDHLGKPAQRGQVKGSHPSMDYEDIPAFMNELVWCRETEARMIETVILSCLRSKEVRTMRKSHLNLADAIWTVPNEVLKMDHGLDHDVPLCPRLVEILRARIETLDEIFGADADYYIWAGRSLTDPLSEDVMRLYLRDELGVDLDEASMHGFRASFSTWADDVLLGTTPPLATDDAVELCMAHVGGSKKGGKRRRKKSKRAYKRATMFVARVPIMKMWAEHCLSQVSAAASKPTQLRLVA